MPRYPSLLTVLALAAAGHLAAPSAAPAAGACTAAGRAAAVVTIAAPGGPSPAGLAIVVSYPPGLVGLPATGESAEVRSRVLDVPDGFLLATNDRDDALRLSLASGTATLADGAILTLSFDRCAGTPPPRAADFGCRVRSAADEFGQPLANITCAVTLPPAAATAPEPTEVNPT